MSSSSSDMDTPTTTNLSNPFLCLPSLVRDEIYRHLLPENNAIWLSRKACVPKPQSGRPPPNQFLNAEYYKAFWQRRQLEHRAVSHWYPREAGFPTEAHLENDKDGYMYGKNGQDVKDYLAMRLVCRQVCVEASALLFRATTLWWTVWDSEIAMVKELVKLENRAEDEGYSSEEYESMPPLCLSIPPKGTEEVTTKEWNSFLRQRKSQALFMWISRFRKVNIIIQESHFVDAFDMVQTMLKLPQLYRLPSFHFVVCGFKLYFDQGLNTWEPLIPRSVTSSYRIFDTQWYGGKDIRVLTNDESLSIRKLIRTHDTGEEWAPDDKEYWSDVFKFCNIRFKADAWIRDSQVDLSGSFIFYERKNQRGEPDKDEDQETIWSG